MKVRIGFAAAAVAALSPSLTLANKPDTLSGTGVASSATTVDDAEDRRVLDERRAWWRQSGRELDVAGLQPLEVVRGARRAPLPNKKSDLTPQAVRGAIDYVSRGRTQSLLVWHRGALRMEYYGPGFGPQSVSAPASMPKPVLALAVGAAVDRGLLQLDDRIGRWLVEWARDPRGAITVRQLLQMQSGLHKDGPTATDARGAQVMLGTHLEAVALETPLERAPGERFDYNNIDNVLLAIVLQRATGTRYARWLSETIWQPIGADDAQVWLDRPDGLVRTFCCLFATARDWVRVGLLIKDRGRFQGRRVLSEAWLREMVAASARNPNYGFQIWRATPYAPRRGYGSGTAAPMPSSEPFLAQDMLIFDGAIGQRIYLSSEKDLVIVRIGASIADWDDSLLPNIVIRGLR